MKIQWSPVSALIMIVLCLLGGCASAPPVDASQKSEVKLYTMGELAGSPYEVVSRLWVGSWRTAVTRPTYPTEDEAISALRVEATRLGANGLVNVVCFDQGRPAWYQRPEPAILCYANAIRVGRSQS